MAVPMVAEFMPVLVMARAAIWLRAELAKLSRHNDVAKGIGYMMNRCPSFVMFLADYASLMTNNAYKRALIALVF